VKIISLNKLDPMPAIKEAINTLEKGGVVVYPTDTVYGLGANALDEYAVEQVFRVKDRPLNKPLPIIARNIKWVKELAFVHPKLEEPLIKIWSFGNNQDKLGPTTIILPKKEIIPWIVTSKQKNVGIRVPDFDFTDKLLGKYGYPLTATSANISGLEPSGDPEEIKRMFSGRTWKPDLFIDAGNLPKSEPSTVLDLSTIKPRILRIGASNPDRLMKLLGVL